MELYNKKHETNATQTGIYVKHSSEGVGEIISVKEDRIEVGFKDGIKRFQFPQVFTEKNKYFSLDILDSHENVAAAVEYFKKERMFEKLLGREIKKSEENESNSWIQECAERARLLEFMESKGFDGFLHTTNFSNFLSIYRMKKLLSRTQLNKLGIRFDDCAEPNIIEGTSEAVKDSNRFYFRPKTPTNYRAFVNHNQKNPVILVLKKEFIYDKSLIFYDGNARSTGSKNTRSALHAYSNPKFKWNGIFSDVIARDSKETDAFLVKEGISLWELKRLQNAEALFKNEISLDSIEKIYFRTEQDYQKAVRELGADSRFICDPKMFST